MNPRFERTELLLGEDAMKIIANAKIAIFGVGGVGGYVVEALARSGIGQLDLIDNDKVCLSNFNRQIIATNENLDKDKVDVFKKRIESINPDIKVNTYNCFYLPDKKDLFDFKQYDYIVDAIDTVTAKIDLIKTAKQLNVPIISAMGCGNRIDPSKLKICDIFKTSGDPLAKVIRKELKNNKINKLTVVYSSELPIKPLINISEEHRRSIPGSTVFVPASAGLMIASYIIRQLIGYKS